MENAEEDLQLLEMARLAAEKAYCAYSNFHVGAAVETEIGIFSGCNVENASYGLSMCAERVALFSAAAAGARNFERLAVSCVDALDGSLLNAKMPCGACRQVMSELMQPGSRIIIDGAGQFLLADLLPQPFRLDMDKQS